MTNDECELYEFSLHTIRELHTNHKLCITNREYAHSVAAPLGIDLLRKHSITCDYQWAQLKIGSATKASLV